MIITGKKFSKPTMSRVINGDIKLKTSEDQPQKVRLDHLLVQKYPTYNRSTLQTFIRSGFVTVDGTVSQKPNSKHLATANVVLSVPSSNKATNCTPLPLIYEDENVLVVDKPAGLLSMAKGSYCPEPTLENYGLLVHRLDRDTSGVVILAKTPETQSFLRKQFQERKAHKVYNAIVVGRPKLNEAKIDLPIARNLKRPTTFQVDPNGKPSITYYKVLSQNANHSLLELRPVTGRTHQLRVHLKYLGTPILGDRVYGTPQTQVPRLFLHAKSLEITLPGGVRKTFVSTLPPDFNQALSA